MYIYITSVYPFNCSTFDFESFFRHSTHFTSLCLESWQLRKPWACCMQDKATKATKMKYCGLIFEFQKIMQRNILLTLFSCPREMSFHPRGRKKHLSPRAAIRTRLKSRIYILIDFNWNIFKLRIFHSRTVYRTKNFAFIQNYNAQCFFFSMLSKD